jgi:hypothetical protein
MYSTDLAAAAESKTGGLSNTLLPGYEVFNLTLRLSSSWFSSFSFKSVFSETERSPCIFIFVENTNGLCGWYFLGTIQPGRIAVSPAIRRNR